MKLSLKYSYFLLIISTVWCMVACKNQSNIVVEHTNFGEEIELQQNLIFTFNTDLIPDSLLNMWRTDSYINFSPKVEGKFKWIGKNELQFSPNFRFEPSTDYEAKLSDALTKYSEKKKLGGDSSVFHFHTPYLQLNNVTIFWAKNALNPAANEVRVTGEFNYAVDISDLKNKLHLTIDGVAKTYQLNNTGTSATINIAILEEGKFDGKLLKLAIDKGLKCADGKHEGKIKINYETAIPSKDNFMVLNAEAQYQDSAAYIQVTTNQQLLNQQDFLKLIKVTPAVANISVELVESGFIVHGSFAEGQSYDLHISPDLKGIFEGRLKTEFTQTIVFGEQKPNISFVNKKGIYLSSKGNKELGVRIINTPKVKVILYKIYANNISGFLRSSGTMSDYYEDGYENDYYVGELSNYGDVVYEKEISTAGLKRANGLSLLQLNFSDINNLSGIYAVSVASTEDNWLRSTKIICISDIGLIAKETENEVLVFAHSIINTEPMAGVEVSLISSNNQEMVKATTDKDGVAKFENLKTKASNFHVNMITAQHKTDFTYLHFEQTRTENSRFEVGGMRNNPSGYQAYIYGDREIYRPGETININTIVRNSTWEPLANAPVKIKLLQPNGKEHSAKQGILNKQGAFASSFALSPAVVTGSYLLEVYTGNDVLLNSRQINIEEFMPDRIKVTAVLNKVEYNLNEQVTASATALNLFGPPAANRNYEIELSLARKEFFSTTYPAFDFALNGNVKATFENDLRQGVTDASGKAEEKFDLPSTFLNTGVLQGKIFSTVFDESGRPVHSLKQFEVFTQNTFVGIKIPDSYVNTQEPMPIDVMALNKKGQLLTNAQAKIEILKYDWQTVLEKDYGSYRYVSQKKVQVLEHKNITISSNYRHTFRPMLSGEYEVRVSLPNSESYVSKVFYAYGWGATSSSSFEVNKEGSVEIVMDKKVYEKGDKANIIFKTPFAGKLLVTVERDKVYQYYTLNTDKRSAALALDIEEAYLPNVYITATLFKPIGDNNVPLTVGHGFAPLMVENKNYRLPVVITAPATSRSSKTQRITIQAGNDKDVELTVAVVDEGILQLKNTATPDPYAFFFQKRALEVNSFDLYPKLLPEFRRSSTGGDGYNLEKRLNPMSNKRVKPVAFWSGLLHTDSDGKAFFDVAVPSFSGDLRIMAVAYDGKAFGANSANMKVADPIVLSTSLPRFLSPSDSVVVNVTVSNTTLQNISGELKISSTGAVKFASTTSARINIKPNSEQQIQFTAIAASTIGTADITTQVIALNEKFTEQNNISVRPASSLVKISQSGMVKVGKPETIGIATQFIPSSVDSKLIVSKSPMVQFSKNLDDLVGYPYGCVEQTVSKAFPQLYLADLTKALNLNSKVAAGSSNYYIQEAINKLQSMQLPSGALSYWQGGYEESWWGTVYAAHFLMEARKAGFEVSANFQDKIYHYLQQKLSTKATEVYYYQDANGKSQHKQIAAKEIFYSLYLLAHAGRQDVSMMNYYKSNALLIPIDGKYLLANTYKIVGDNNSYRKLLPASFDGEKSVTALGGSFYSYVRDLAISLNTLIETDPTHPQVGILARHLSQQLKAERYLSTQQLSFSLIALGKVARRAALASAKGTVNVDGKAIAQYTNGELVIKNNQLKNNISITATEGELYYFYQAEGLPLAPKIVEEDNFLKVRRTYLSRTGAVLQGNTFAQNDLIVVKISLQTTDGSKVENVVLTDILPAGFEVENPRITEIADMPWLKNQAVAEHQDIRDDRVNLFTTATANVQDFYYTVRAVSKGRFVLGPVSADAMYNGEYHSYHGAGRVVVR